MSKFKRIVNAIPHFLSRLRHFNIKGVIGFFLSLTAFLLLLVIFSTEKVYAFILRRKILGFVPRLFIDPVLKKTHQLIPAPLKKIISKFTEKIDFVSEGGLRRRYLLELAFRNIALKKTRALVTVGGVGVGIGAIVFLVSLGYGLERLVTKRVAGLNEMRIADVTLGKSSLVRIDDASLARFAAFRNIDRVLPTISLVGRVSYKGSISDVVVYGVTKSYFEFSDVNLTRGKIFESDATVASRVFSPQSGQVAGASISYLPERFGGLVWPEEIKFNIGEGEWIKVRQNPSLGSETLGFTKRAEGGFTGYEHWGGQYDSDESLGRVVYGEEGQWLGLWLQALVPLYDGEGESLLDEEGFPVWKEGFLGENGIVKEDGFKVSEISEGRVLAAETESEEATAAADLVDLSERESTSSAEANEASPSATIVKLGADGPRQAVVNTAMLKVLGLTANDALGEKFEVSFVVVKTLMPEISDKLISEPESYEIIGIVPEEKTPYFYVPFVDLRSLGVTNFSQAKVLVSGRDKLEEARRQVENLGFKTSSVADTVAQIENIFGMIRMVLASLGLVALAVASLGMFNTLTVSLLERTREVGIMKVMGMQSREVRELFLAEAMVMGTLGGIFGIGIGFGVGKLVDIILTVVALAQDHAIISVTHVPSIFVLAIFIFSSLVGIITGLYPARRATKIPALDALRYE